MMKQYSITVVLLALTLTACVNSRAPSSPPTNSATPSANQTASKNISSQCPTELEMKVDGKATSITAPNPFAGLENPSMETIKDRLSMGLITKEAGLYELTDFETKNLKTGTYNGQHFRLMLINSPYSDSDCNNANHKSDAKLTITEYNAENGQLVGCFYGKLDCGGKLIEINAPISGSLH
jgi:PBP1b-binding outer membrane lipoprotein LpoB